MCGFINSSIKTISVAKLHKSKATAHSCRPVKHHIRIRYMTKLWEMMAQFSVAYRPWQVPYKHSVNITGCHQALEEFIKLLFFRNSLTVVPGRMTPSRRCLAALTFVSTAGASGDLKHMNCVRTRKIGFSYICCISIKSCQWQLCAR